MEAFVVLHAMNKKQIWIWITALCNQFLEEDGIPGYERDLQRVYHKRLRCGHVIIDVLRDTCIIF